MIDFYLNFEVKINKNSAGLRPKYETSETPVKTEDLI